MVIVPLLEVPVRFCSPVSIRQLTEPTVDWMSSVSLASLEGSGRTWKSMISIGVMSKVSVMVSV